MVWIAAIGGWTDYPRERAVVTLGEPHGESSGSDMIIENLIVFR